MLALLLAGGGPAPADAGWPAALLFIGVFVLIGIVGALRASRRASVTGS